MSSTVVSSAPVTSWWYGQGGAVGVVRRLEALYTLNPPPATAGLITARLDELTATFVQALRVPLPQPWHPLDSGSESRIAWDAVDPGTDPDPLHPVYLVVLGTSDDGGLIAMNLAAFARIRIDGDRATTTALASRWVLELLATHPSITIGVTDDVWSGPLTTRVRPVRVGAVPDVDVLVCGPDLSYTDRAQIVSNATSRIMVDLGKDAAVDSKWTITCGPDRVGQLSNGGAQSITATLILPSGDTVDRCADLLTSPPPASGPSRLPAPPVAVDDDPVTDPAIPVAAAPDPAGDDIDAPYDGGIDFFEPQGVGELVDVDEVDEGPPWVVDEPAAGQPEPVPAVPAPVPAPVAAAAVAQAAPQVPVVAPLWNRLLGQLVMSPPYPGQEPGVREKRLNELLVFLQMNPWVSTADIVRSVYRDGASDKTVTQQISLLRARLGVIRTGGPKALPPMSDGAYRLDGAVRSDWMEFERLVEIRPETTAPGHLIAAMSLVTGPPLGSVTPKEWEWAKNLRGQLRDRVPGAAVVLARHHHEAQRFSDAVEIARKGLWYDNERQDLWQVALQAALDGHEHDAFKKLRGQYLNTVAVVDQDPAVLDLTKQAG